MILMTSYSRCCQMIFLEQRRGNWRDPHAKWGDQRSPDVSRSTSKQGVPMLCYSHENRINDPRQPKPQAIHVCLCIYIYIQIKTSHHLILWANYPASVLTWLVALAVILYHYILLLCVYIYTHSHSNNLKSQPSSSSCCPKTHTPPRRRRCARHTWAKHGGHDWGVSIELSK